MQTQIGLCRLLGAGEEQSSRLIRVMAKHMFGNFSTRSKQIVFAARFNAGERGADMIDTDDLLAGVILEDQAPVESLLFSLVKGQGRAFNKVEPREPFFSASAAENLLADLKKKLPRSGAVPLVEELPMSASLHRVFDSAEAFRAQFRSNHVEPLHLLAAILKENSGEGPRLLERWEITELQVLSALKGAKNL